MLGRTQRKQRWTGSSRRAHQTLQGEDDLGVRADGGEEVVWVGWAGHKEDDPDD